ncbi:hypothetical protein ASL20_29630 [Cupriavidus necator]|uniref:hypothetical protein n=1 Tax=Cupriavidus necator TaxID=106590 RepID=UPI0007352AB4|nr:hypothetical protein [Cupriavidus necator]KUE85244.1 hypothetical protein ASL20_29630 [Cupriavidus necator]
MSDQFDNDLMEDLSLDEYASSTDYGDTADDAADHAALQSGLARTASPFDEDGGDDAFTDETDSADMAAAQDTDIGDHIDQMAVWNAFEEEVADGLDAADDDEFLGRLLGGLGRAAGVISRQAGRMQGVARRAGRVAGQVGRVAQAASPTANAAAALARMLGAPNLARGLQTAGRLAGDVSHAARQARRQAGALGTLGGGTQDMLAQISQLLASQASASQGMDAMIDLYANDGIDEALPAAVALATRAAARGLGLSNVAQLSAAGRRQLVRGVASAARELVRAGGPGATRALAPLARAATRVARQRQQPPNQAARALRRGLPQAARRVVANPRMLDRLAQPAPPGPMARPTGIGRGVRTIRPRRPRTFHFGGPVTLTVAPR